MFKGLLFLGAGSVVQATHTRNMEEMGGLIRRMPVTALCFLVGAVAISGLPPLNGFVSEWLTYQALLAGFGTTQSLTRVMFPIAGSLLALTAALAAACFVKAFAIPFLALPRSEKAAEAREASFPMRAGMVVLAVGCVALGLGATGFVPVFDPITQQTLGVRASSALVTAHGWALSPGTPHGGTISTAGIALFFLLAGAAFALPLALRWRRRSARGPAWDCGLPGLTADNEYTATAFSKPLRMIFSALYRPQPGDPGRIRSIAVLPERNPLRKRDRTHPSRNASTIRCGRGFWLPQTACAAFRRAASMSTSPTFSSL